MAHKKSFGGDFQRFFGRGLAILLPSIVTLWLLYQAFSFVFSNVAEPINRALRVGVIHAIPVLLDEADRPSWYVVTDEQVGQRAARVAAEGLSEVNESSLREEIRHQQFLDVWRSHWYLSGLGLVVAIVLIYLAGLLLGNYIGRRLYTRVESLIARVPGFKQVYPHVKQVVDLIFGENPAMKAFSEVVLVQYPREGLWSLGFIASNSFRQVHEAAGGDSVTVFIPTSPTPMTGFVVSARRDQVKRLDISMDKALRFVITAGVLTPDHKDATGPLESPEASARLAKPRRGVGVAEDPPGL